MCRSSHLRNFRADSIDIRTLGEAIRSTFRLPLPAANIKSVRPASSLALTLRPFPATGGCWQCRSPRCGSHERASFQFRPMLQQEPHGGRRAIAGRRQVQRRAAHLGAGIDIGSRAHQEADFFRLGNGPHQRRGAEIVLTRRPPRPGQQEPACIHAAVGSGICSGVAPCLSFNFTPLWSYSAHWTIPNRSSGYFRSIVRPARSHFRTRQPTARVPQSAIAASLNSFRIHSPLLGNARRTKETGSKLPVASE